MRTVPTTHAAKKRPPVKMQVLDATTGCRNHQFPLLEKRDFRRSHWILRILEKLSRAKKKNKRALLMSDEERNTMIQTALNEIKHMEKPTSYEQVLQPLFSTVEKLCENEEQKRMMKLFSSLLCLIVESSAMFLHQSVQKEKELGSRGHYRALTNYWAYLIIGTIVNNDDAVLPSVHDGVYAYSFMYPYSDDLMDSTDVNVYQKKMFFKNIATRLLGGTVHQFAFESNNDKSMMRFESRVYTLIGHILSCDTKQKSSTRIMLCNQSCSIEKCEATC